MGSIKVVRTVIDTNVVISAPLFGGTPGELALLWKTGRIKVFTSKEIIDEYLRVLAYPRFNLTEKEIEYLLYHEILPYFIVSSPKTGSTIIKEDPSDDIFIRCAEVSGSRIIISDDKHLLKLRRYGKIEILSPSQFLEKQGL